MSGFSLHQFLTLLRRELGGLLRLGNAIPHVFDKLDLLRGFQAGEGLKDSCRTHGGNIEPCCDRFQPPIPPEALNLFPRSPIGG